MGALRELVAFIARKEQIPGGLAEGKTPPHFNEEQLEKGIKVEMEHTNSRAVAEEIAMDHLTEDAKYYDKLEKIEGKHGSGKAPASRAPSGPPKKDKWIYEEAEEAQREQDRPRSEVSPRDVSQEIR